MRPPGVIRAFTATLRKYRPLRQAVHAHTHTHTHNNMETMARLYRVHIVPRIKDLYHLLFVLLFGSCEEIAVQYPGLEDGDGSMQDTYHRVVRTICTDYGLPIRSIQAGNVASAAPLYITDDSTTSQGLAMVRYLGKHIRLYPKDPESALAVDEWLEYHRDMMLPMDIHAAPERFGVGVADAEWLREVHLPAYLSKLEVHLAQNGGQWIAALDQRSLADIVWLESLHRIRSLQGAEYFDDYPEVSAYICVATSDHGGAKDSRRTATTAIPDDAACADESEEECDKNEEKIPEDGESSSTRRLTPECVVPQ